MHMYSSSSICGESANTPMVLVNIHPGFVFVEISLADRLLLCQHWCTRDGTCGCERARDKPEMMWGFDDQRATPLTL